MTRLRFVRRDWEASGTASFLFAPAAPIDFVAGQYLSYTLPHANPDERGDERAFTIASAPGEPLVRLTARLGDEPSSFKRALAGMAPGDVVDAAGPYGDFVYQSAGRPAVLLAGGIGITPFRAMLADLAASPRRPEVTLLYSNATPDFAFRTFLERLQPSWPGLRLVFTLSRPQSGWNGAVGRIDAAFIRRHVPAAAHADYYICGPSGMVDALRAVLLSNGTDEQRIRSEGFPGYDQRRLEASAAPSDMARNFAQTISS